MSSFTEFYFNGGFFNHLITIGFGVSAMSLVFFRRSGEARWLRTAARALLACVGLGVLGASLGVIEVGAAALTVPPKSAPMILAQGYAVAIHPLVWALLGALPLWIAHTVASHRREALAAA